MDIQQKICRNVIVKFFKIAIVAYAFCIAGFPAIAGTLSAKESKEVREEARLAVLKNIDSSEISKTMNSDEKEKFLCMKDLMVDVTVNALIYAPDPRAAILKYKKDGITPKDSNPKVSVEKQQVLKVMSCVFTKMAGNLRQVSDVLVDYKELSGSFVRVRGFFLSLGEMNFLYEKAGTTTALMIDTSDLSRDERKKIITECGRGCEMTFYGTVEMVNFNKGLRAKFSDEK